MGTILELRQEIFNRLCRFALSNRRDMKVAMPDIFRDGRFRTMTLQINKIVLAREDEKIRIGRLKNMALELGLNFEVRE